MYTLKRRLDDYEKLKKEMKTLKDKMNKSQFLRVPLSKNDMNKGQVTSLPPSTPTRKQAKTPLRMTRPPKYNESPEVPATLNNMKY